MDQIIHWFGFLHDPEKLKALVLWGSYPVLAGMIYSETGLFIGFFLPGDSLLVTAGILAGQGYLSIGLLYLLLSAAAILGDNTGYWIGRKTGPVIFSRPKSLLFNPKHITRAQKFYDKYGGKTVVMARFLPLFRTFAPIVAGVGKMRYKRFLTFSVLGGISWITSVASLGFFIGRIPGVNRYLHIILALVIVVSFIPGAVEFLVERRRSKKKA